MVSIKLTILLMYSSITSNEVPSGAVDIIRNLLLSSSGANSEGISAPNPRIIASAPSIIGKASHRLAINAVNDLSYAADNR